MDIYKECPQCHFENPSQNSYCSKCGAKLTSLKETSTTPTVTLQMPKKELRAGSTFTGRYQVIEELGRGGMGRVYRVIDNEIKEEVALKILNPEIVADESTIERFRKELKFARKITHKNVCRMYDLNKGEETYYITMEYVSGEDLKSLIRRIGQLPEGKAVSIAVQVGEGLAEAHRLGVVHRDLKPQNIMIDKEGKARIMDFGIARSLEAKGVTEVGMIIGTPDYMSPEQVEGKEADQRSDIYSLGIIIYEMVTGRVPFEGRTALSIALKHKTEIPLDPRELNEHVSEELSSVILRCMEKDRDKRYQRAEELVSELRGIEEGTTALHALVQPQVPAFLIEPKEETEIERPAFVAREQEFDKLGKFLERTISGKGQIVFITGEAGSGKTALIQEFARQAQEAHSDLILTIGKCNAQTGIGDPYLPFIEILNLLTGDVETKWTAGIISRKHAVRLWNLIPLSAAAILNNGPDLIDTFVRGLALASRSKAFTSARTTWLTQLEKLVERKSSLPADSTLQQSNLFEQYTRVIQALSGEQPLVLVLDDLQWVDAGSAGLLFHLGRRIKGSRILVIGAFRQAELALGREGERHPLEPVVHEFKRDYGDIEIEVGQAEGQQFVNEFIDSEPNQLSTFFRDRLYRQTQGHPLFTVELIRNMQERGVLVKNKDSQWIEKEELNWDTLPVRVDAVIEERISRLTERLREILTLASVEGEEFTAEVVANLQKTEVRKLIRILSSELDKRHHLVQAKGIRKLEGQRLSLYLFRHILFQKYLYNNLDEVERASLHEEVGHILETLYGQQAEEIAVQLARHFQEAGIIPKAVEYLYKAGNKAVSLSANEEAIVHFNRALGLLKMLPSSSQRIQQELSLQLALHAPLQATRGFGAPELGKATTRAQELCQQIGDPSQLFMALAQLATFYATRAEYRTALELGKQIKDIALQAKDPMLMAIFHLEAIWPLLNVGEFIQARDSADFMISFYKPEQHGFLAFKYGFDLGVMAMGFGSWVLWFLGYPDQALKQCEEAIALARRLDHSHTTAFILVAGCELGWFLRDFQRVDEYTEELIPLSSEKGFIYWKAHGIFYRGERQTLKGQIKEGIAQMSQGLDDMLATGTNTCLTRLLCRMADACKKTGQIDQGLKAIAEGMEAMNKYDERYMEAELFRLKGELLLIKDGDDSEAEQNFHQAIEVSRRRQARSLELRAVMSLSRLLKKQGKKEKARKLLAEIYGWFTEGFDTPDLKEAKVLLESLS